MTIFHAGGPSLYYPLRQDDPASGVPAPERSRLLAGIARAKQHGMRVVLGISPYAPVEIVRKHPDWMRPRHRRPGDPRTGEARPDHPREHRLRALAAEHALRRLRHRMPRGDDA